MVTIRERRINGRHVFVRYDRYGHICALASDRAGVEPEALRQVGMPVPYRRRRYSRHL
jgi:hypothetical protein